MNRIHKHFWEHVSGNFLHRNQTSTLVPNTILAKLDVNQTYNAPENCFSTQMYKKSPLSEGDTPSHTVPLSVLNDAPEILVIIPFFIYLFMAT